MIGSTARRIRRIRAVTLFSALALFVTLLLLLRNPGVPYWLSRGIFFAIDPLVLLQHLAATRTMLFYCLAALVPLTLTLVLGRFFCGWLCPFGALHEFVSWITGKRPGRKAPPDRRRLRIKYLIFIVVILCALAGTALGGWLDPFALLARSTAAAIEPAADAAVPHAASGLSPVGPAPAPRRSARVAVQPVLIGVIFLLIVGLNTWKRRFFCTTLCPLGALYGLVARFSLLRFATTPDCNDCGLCAARCSFQGGAGKDYIKSECDVCLACVQDCQRGGVRVQFGSPVEPSGATLDFGRRRLLGTAATGLAIAALPMVALEARPQTKAGHGFLRPPGSVPEKIFLSHCVRCGQCVESCPTNFIQPAQLEAGFEGLWTPVLNPQAGYCAYDCNLCTKACPTGAIQPLALVYKQGLKLGTAAIDKCQCLTYVDGADCRVCVEKCPVPSKPLRFRRTVVQDRSGNLITVQQVYVVPDLCTGCGICEHFCPKGGAPGIIINSEDEDRQAVRMA